MKIKRFIGVNNNFRFAVFELDNGMTALIGITTNQNAVDDMWFRHLFYRDEYAYLITEDIPKEIEEYARQRFEDYSESEMFEKSVKNNESNMEWLKDSENKKLKDSIVDKVVEKGKKNGIDKLLMDKATTYIKEHKTANKDENEPICKYVDKELADKYKTIKEKHRI